MAPEYTDKQIVAEAENWRWVPQGTREIKFERFALHIYPDGWNRNFVQLESGHRLDAEIYSKATSAARELGVGRLTWCIVDSLETQDSAQLLLEDGYSISESLELLAWRMGASREPLLPEITSDPEFSVVMVDNFELFRIEKNVGCKVFGLPFLSDEDTKKEWGNGPSPEAQQIYASFLVYKNSTPISTAGLTMSGRVVKLWGAGTLTGFRGRGAYRLLVRARLAEGHARGGTIGVVNARIGTSGPILKRIGFRTVAIVREYTGSTS